MYDSGKVIAGLVIFLALMTSPFWLNMGRTAELPKLAMPAPENGKLCVESKEYMRSNHMQVLDDWRFTAVREGAREHVSLDGRKFNKSLTKTCLRCHDNKKEFCDKCHAYVGVKPYCFTCHVDPKEKL